MNKKYYKTDHTRPTLGRCVVRIGSYDYDNTVVFGDCHLIHFPCHVSLSILWRSCCCLLTFRLLILQLRYQKIMFCAVNIVLSCFCVCLIRLSIVCIVELFSSALENV